MNFKVGILIPTLNRHEFVLNQLDFYAKNKCNHTVYIGDSSDKEISESIQSELKKYDGKLNIKYFYIPDLNDRQAISFLAEKTTEEYCAFIGDDDYFIPNSLSICSRFLYENPEYRTAQGLALIFTKKSTNEIHSYRYWNADTSLFEEDDIIKRLNFFSNNYWNPQFSVHRTREFIIDSQFYKDIKDKTFGELIHSYTFISGGKSKFLDCLYLIRQDHESRYLLPTLLDWLSSQFWRESYLSFKISIVDQIIKQKNISKEHASKDFDKIFGSYIGNSFYKKYVKFNHNRFFDHPLFYYLMNRLFYKNNLSFSFILKTRRNKYFKDAFEIYSHISN